jgi:Icc-related predicted phosphoesterase
MLTPLPRSGCGSARTLPCGSGASGYTESRSGSAMSESAATGLELTSLRVAVTADWHGYTPSCYPECDLMFVAGDVGLPETFGARGLSLEEWLAGASFPVVAVAGNHDFDTAALRVLDWIYLEDEVAEVAGLRIWGTPWSNPFGHGWAFNMPEAEQRVNLRRVPDDVDVIVSHGPAFGFGDLTKGWGGRAPERVGSDALLARALELPRLKLVASGHIHSAYGRVDAHGIAWVNGSLVDEDYQVANAPLVVSMAWGQGVAA